MTDAFRTVYVFELQVDGRAAKEQAKILREELAKELGAISPADINKGIEASGQTATKATESFKPLKSVLDQLNSSLAAGAEAWRGYNTAMASAVTNARNAQTALAKTPGATTSPAATPQEITPTRITPVVTPPSVLPEPINITPPDFDSWKAFTANLQETSRIVWPIRRIGYDFEHMGRRMVMASAAASAAMYGLTQSYVSFDQAATRAAMAMRLQPELTDDLRNSIQAAAKEMGMFDPSEIAEGLRLWAAGTGEVIQSQDQLNRMLGDTVAIQKLAAINNVEFSQTVDDVGGIMHEFGLQTKDVGMITETLNYVASESFANVNDLGQAFKMVGPLANELGVSFQETATALALLSDNNVKGTMAGRALRQVFISLIDPTEESNAILNELFKTNERLGESWRDLVFPNEEFIGLAETFDLLAASTEEMTDSQRAQLAALLQNANAIPAFVTMLRQQNEAREYGINAMRAYEKVMTGVVDAEVLAYKRMYEQTTGLPFSLEGAHARMTNMWEEYEKSDSARMMRLQQRWKTALIDMGEPITEVLIPALEKALSAFEKIAIFAEQHPDLFKIGTYGAVGAVSAGLIIGGLANVVGALAQSGAAIKAIVDAMKRTAAAQAAATAAGAAVSGTVASGGAAAAVVSILKSPLVIAAIIPLVGAIVSIITGKEQRKASEAALERTPDAVVSRFEELFRKYPTGRSFVAQTPEADEIVRELRKQGALSSPLEHGLATMWEMSVPSLAEPRTAFAAQDIGVVLRYLASEMANATEDNIAFRKELATPGYDIMRSSTKYQPSYIESLAAPTTTQTEEGWESVMKYYRFQQEKTDILRRGTEERRTIEDNYNKWLENAQENLALQFAEMESARTKSLLREQEDLQESITDIQVSANKQREQAESAHLESLRNMQIAHAQRMVDLLEARDVQGITKEMRSYKTQVEQQNRSFSQQQQDASRNLSDQIAKMEEDSRKRREREEEDYQERVLAMKEEFARQTQEQLEQRDEALAASRKAQNEALQELNDDFYENIVGLEALLDAQYPELLQGMETFKENYVGKWVSMTERVKELAAELMISSYAASSMLGSMVVPTPPLPAIPNYGESSGAPSRASGGYVDSGLYTLHEGEFVLSPKTTQEMESRYGFLSQSTFSGMGGQTTIFSPTFNGMGVQDRQWYLKAASDMFDQKMMQLKRRVR